MTTILRKMRPLMRRVGQFRRSQLPLQTMTRVSSLAIPGRLQMTPAEEQSAVEVFNSANEKDLQLLGFNESDRKLLLAARAERGRFESLESLSNIQDLRDGVVLNAFKKVLASKLLAEKKKMSKSNPLRIQPMISSAHLKEIETFVAVDCNQAVLNWVGMNREGTVTDLGTELIEIQSDMGFDNMEYHLKLLDIQKRIPKADCYFMERPRFRRQRGWSRAAEKRLVQQTVVQALLTALLNKGVTSPSEYRVRLFNMMSVAQHHKLLVGGEMVGTEAEVTKLIERTGTISDDRAVFVPYQHHEALLNTTKESYKLIECLLVVSAFYKCYIASQFNPAEAPVRAEPEKRVSLEKDDSVG